MDFQKYPNTCLTITIFLLIFLNSNFVFALIAFVYFKQNELKFEYEMMRVPTARGVIVGDSGYCNTSEEVERLLKDMQRCNVLVVGQSRVGKSSLINLIGRQKGYAKTSSGLIGCTLTFAPYRITSGTSFFNIFDSPGLYELNEGAVPHSEAISTLYKLSKNTPINLILLVVKEFQKPEKNTYEFLTDILYEGKMPCIVVINNADRHIPSFNDLDFGSNLDCIRLLKFHEQQIAALEQKMPNVGVCSSELKEHYNLRTLSREQLVRKMHDLCLTEPILSEVSTYRFWFQVGNWMKKRLGIKLPLIKRFYGKLKDKMGLSVEEIDKVVDGI